MTYMLDGRQYVLIQSGNTIIGVRAAREMSRSKRVSCKRFGEAEDSRSCTVARDAAIAASLAARHGSSTARRPRATRRRCRRCRRRSSPPSAADPRVRGGHRARRTRGASRSCPTATCSSPSARAGCASSATACSIRRRLPACPCRTSRALLGGCSSRAASALRREPRRLSHLLEGARGQALHDGAGARPTFDGKALVDVEGHLRRQHVEHVEHELRRPHRVRSRRLPLSHGRRAPGAGARAETRGARRQGAAPARRRQRAARQSVRRQAGLPAGDLHPRSSQPAGAGAQSRRPARCGRTSTARSAATSSTSSSRARNYGWPLVTFGTDYDGTKISDAHHAPGSRVAVHVLGAVDRHLRA